MVGVCRVENRSTQLRFEEAVREEQQREREGEGQVGNLDYEFLVWREGLSLDDVVAKGKFPQQVSPCTISLCQLLWSFVLLAPPLPLPSSPLLSPSPLPLPLSSLSHPPPCRNMAVCC